MVVGRDALMDQLWKGRNVSDTTISTAIKSARKALGDTGRDQKYIRTVRGCGIQWVVPQHTEKLLPAETCHPSAEAGENSVLYVRCTDVTDDPAMSPLLRTMRVRASSILTRIPLLRIATAFEQADLLSDPREQRARFAVTHVLDLRLQRAEQWLTVDAALIETRSGIQIWAQRFASGDGPGDQETLLYEMIRRIEPRLMQAMMADLQLQGADSAYAHASLLKAIGMLALRGWNRATFEEATGLIEHSIALDSGLALSHAYLALVKALGHRVGLLRHDEQVKPAAIAAAEMALCKARTRQYWVW